MEQTAEEKLQQAEREFRDRQIEEMRENHLRAVHDMKEQQKVTMELYEERRQELLRQNEGMLGAVGRLHTENEKLKQDNAALMAAALDGEQKLKQKDREIHMRAELIERDTIRVVKDLEEKLAAERAKNKAKKK